MRAVIAAAVGLALAAGNAHADRSVAARLFEEGRTLYDQGKFIEACVLFEKSFELDPAVGTKLNLAECAERDGKPRKAWLMWIEAAEEFEKTPDKAVRAKYARERADALAPKLATIVVKVAKPRTTGLTIRIGGRDVAPVREVVERLEPGEVTVVATAPDREKRVLTVTGKLGETVEVELPALVRVGGGPEPAIAPEVPIDTPPNLRPWKITAIASGAVVVICSVAAVYFVRQLRQVEEDIKGLREDDPNFKALNDKGEANELRANIMTGIGMGAAAVAVVAVVKILVTPSERSTKTAKLQLAPVVGKDTAGASLSFRW